MELTVEEKSWAVVKIQRDILQEDALSPLLFVIMSMVLNPKLRKCSEGYKLTKSQEKSNPLEYMDDIKLLDKKEKELEILKLTGRILSDDIRMT